MRFVSKHSGQTPDMRRPYTTNHTRSHWFYYMGRLHHQTFLCPSTFADFMSEMSQHEIEARKRRSAQELPETEKG
jgi:hypothetical protein